MKWLNIRNYSSNFLIYHLPEEWRKLKHWANKKSYGHNFEQREDNGNGDEMTCNWSKNAALLQLSEVVENIYWLI